MRAAVVLITVFGLGIPVSPAAVPVPTPVSLMQLIVTPEKYDGQKVTTIGYLHLEFENYAVYMHEEDVRHSILLNRIRISI